MCGRFVSSSSPERIAEYFDAQPPEADLGESYNVAPTNDVYAVVQRPDGTRHVEVFHWGLVPSWAKDVKVGYKMINARAETLAEKPAYKKLLRTRRCLVPMDGFYEWQAGRPDGPRTKSGKPAKQPMYVTRLDGEPLGVAGLWAVWRDPAAGPEAPWLHSCTIVTTAANDLMAPIHDRMPVVLPASAWEAWLDPANDDLDVLSGLLLPAPEGMLTARPVSPEVNTVTNRGPELVAPYEPPAPDDTSDQLDLG